MSAQSVVALTLPASDVEARLVAALRDLDAARQNAVIWFGEILARKLYLEFGCSSIHHYARPAAGVLAGADRVLPAALPVLRGAAGIEGVGRVGGGAVDEGSRGGEGGHAGDGVVLGRSGADHRTARVGAAGGGDAGRGAGPAAGAGAGGTAGGQMAWMARRMGRRPEPMTRWTDAAVVSPVTEVPVTVSFQLSPEQYARYEAMLERARKSGLRGSREELFLAAWEMITRGRHAARRDRIGVRLNPQVSARPAAPLPDRDPPVRDLRPR